MTDNESYNTISISLSLNELVSRIINSRNITILRRQTNLLFIFDTSFLFLHPFFNPSSFILTIIILPRLFIFLNRIIANYSTSISIVLIQKIQRVSNNSTLYLRNFFTRCHDEKGDENRLYTSLLSLPTLCSTALFRGHASSHLLFHLADKSRFRGNVNEASTRDPSAPENSYRCLWSFRGGVDHFYPRA